MAEDQLLYLLDGMALIYRAHFALIRTPIRTSKGFNTSAIFGFTNTLLDILEKRRPTHIAVAFDTSAPTERHKEFEAYKAQREEMPEDISLAIPHVRRMLEAFRIPCLTLDGFEADDIIGTLAARAEAGGFTTCMVTPDKDFGQLVTERTLIYKPGRQGGDAELLGVKEVCERWGLPSVDRVIDLLGLMGDASDNIPGVPGVGEKTAVKLIAEYGSLEQILAAADSIKGKLGERIREHRAQAELSKRLATIRCDAPIPFEPDKLARQEPDTTALSALMVEFEFNSLGRRLLGDAFKAGRGHSVEVDHASGDSAGNAQPDLFSAALTTISDAQHLYRIAATPSEIDALLSELASAETLCFDLETTALSPADAEIVGMAVCATAGEAWYIPFPPDAAAAQALLEKMKPLLTKPGRPLIGHNLKFDLSVLAWHGLEPDGPFFDTMLAHALIEPAQRHGMDVLAETYLGYTPVPIERLIGEKSAEQKSMRDVPLDQIAEYAAEDADVTFRLHQKLGPLLDEKGQTRVFHQIECPLLPALVSMEKAGVAIDTAALAEYSTQLGAEIASLDNRIVELAGRPFNLNSPKQLGEILFDELRLLEKPKRTRTGQYVTDEQILQTLSGHEIVRLILEYREAVKLKSTYVDALPLCVSPRTGRIHTNYSQAVTSTGRMASTNPNLQNIPIRSERGREIRKAFIPAPGLLLLSADYSQIELRIMAELSGDPAMREAFQSERDIHTDTAAKVFGVNANEVTADMRRSAKTVNFGIIYGISAFGLSQRLAIPREDARMLIDQYFATFPGVRAYMADTIASCREKGYVETVTGRRRYLPDVRSANATVRNAAERNAINAPIQGTAADMIKIAMATIHRELAAAKLRTQMLLQVHDELVFELVPEEKEEAIALITQAMTTAIPMTVPVEVESGVGTTWLDAH